MRSFLPVLAPLVLAVQTTGEQQGNDAYAGNGYNQYNQGYNNQGYNGNGYDGNNQGYNGNGYDGNNQGYNGNGYDGNNQGYNGNGYDGNNQGNDGNNQGYNGNNQGYNGYNQGNAGNSQGYYPNNQGYNGDNQGNDANYQNYNANDVNGEYGDGYVANYDWNNANYENYNDQNGNGEGGAWINGVYRPFCDSDDDYEVDEDTRVGECIDYNKYIPHENCAQGIITVKSVSITCDSPYMSYFSNAAHKNSELCDYGDKALVTVFFENAYDLPVKQVFFTLGVYARKTNLELVYAARNVDLSTLVGHQCTRKGDYAFAFRITMDWVMGDRSEFVPVVEMGFSTQADEGYNLGGVNIDCKFDSGYRPYDPWVDKATTWGAGTAAGFAANYGILIGVFILLVAFGLYAYRKQDNQIEWSSNWWQEYNPFHTEKKPMEQELVVSPSGSVAEA